MYSAVVHLIVAFSCCSARAATIGIAGDRPRLIRSEHSEAVADATSGALAKLNRQAATLEYILHEATADPGSARADEKIVGKLATADAAGTKAVEAAAEQAAKSKTADAGGADVVEAATKTLAASDDKAAVSKAKKELAKTFDFSIFEQNNFQTPYVKKQGL